MRQGKDEVPNRAWASFACKADLSLYTETCHSKRPPKHLAMPLESKQAIESERVGADSQKVR